MITAVILHEQRRPETGSVSEGKMNGYPCFAYNGWNCSGGFRGGPGPTISAHNTLLAYMND